ncbi:MAG: PDZ domain-containing protein [Planctomycetota bacterium]|nr:MAG: PDZ domain-containing protein [Planctomycetota bacterium]REJ94454.1 MAG: PDZ domain-containing protein [Planctomycetota bacterium]REK22113.1 MAG: PDZ domain-containing protein [Planctomycetota bacterium]REK44558.1 MAG: PDZ domain-containing protein [Planctomycetota bacterium]
MSGKRAGSEIRLRFARGGVEGEAVVLLGVPPGFEEVEDDRARPVPPQVPQDEPLPADVTDDGLLLGVRTVLPQLRDLLRIKAPGQFTRGALVQEVYAGTPAAAAGLPVDALIFAVDGRNIVSPAELISRIKRAGAGNIVELTYFANGAQQKVQVQLATPRMVGRPPAGQPLPPAPADPGLEARLGALERRMTAMEQRLVDLQRTLDALRQQR